MKRPKISFFVHNLSANAVVRLGSLAPALERDFDMEVLGLILDGGDVFEAYKNRFEFKTIHCSWRPHSVMKAIPALAARATGDLIYACKPLLTSYGPALVASRFGRGKPLFLDADDDEWATFASSKWEFFRRHILRGWGHAAELKYTLMLHPFTFLARARTVVSRKLHQRHGGYLVRQSVCEQTFNPDRYTDQSRREIRRRYNLPLDKPLLLFAGTFRAHKGCALMFEALAQPQAGDWHMVLAGHLTDEAQQLAVRTIGGRSTALGVIPNREMPDLLAAVDAVAVPQLRHVFTQSQVPAKLAEALAMARPLIVSRVGDLDEIMGHGERGWVIEPGDPQALAAALHEIQLNPAEAGRRAKLAREWFLKEASAQAIRQLLAPVLLASLQKKGAGPAAIPSV